MEQGLYEERCPMINRLKPVVLVRSTRWKRRGKSGLGEVTAGCRLPPLGGG